MARALLAQTCSSGPRGGGSTNVRGDCRLKAADVFSNPDFCYNQKVAGGEHEPVHYHPKHGRGP